MIEEVSPGLFRIEVPLPRNPLKAVNSYVIKAREHSLIIDTGMNREECMSAISSGLRELGIALNEADFLITHMHADHSGLVSTLAGGASKIYCGQSDAAVIGSIDFSHWEKQIDFARMSGFPEDELQKAIRNHPGYRYGSRGHLEFCVLKEGDALSAGDYLFKCVETPGHTSGHICLYEQSRKLFISGDHILIDITPNISLWSDEKDPLNEYLMSLDKVYNLDVELVLPGHRGTFRHFKERIQELIAHHQARAGEVLSILEGGEQDAFQVASRMSWDMDYECWGQFPVSQKWFAIGEAIAHLKYLGEKGKIRRKMRGQRAVFLPG